VGSGSAFWSNVKVREQPLLTWKLQRNYTAGLRFRYTKWIDVASKLRGLHRTAKPGSYPPDSCVL
jgi:hypothetical protein